MKHPLSTFDGEYNSSGDEVSIRSVAREMKSQLFSFDVKNASYEESMKLDDILSFFFLSLSASNQEFDSKTVVAAEQHI